jgi:hypothetical protein
MRLQALEEYSKKVENGLNMLEEIGSGLQTDPVFDQGSSGGQDVD